jgi:hypothetical protein
LTDAGRYFPANLCQTGIDLTLRGLGCLCIFQADLLLDKRTANQLLEGTLWCKNSESGIAGVKDRQAHLVIYVAIQDGLVVDHGYNPVKHHGVGGRSSRGGVLNKTLSRN